MRKQLLDALKAHGLAPEDQQTSQTLVAQSINWTCPRFFLLSPFLPLDLSPFLPRFFPQSVLAVGDLRRLMMMPHQLTSTARGGFGWRGVFYCTRRPGGYNRKVNPSVVSTVRLTSGVDHEVPQWCCTNGVHIRSCCFT